MITPQFLAHILSALKKWFLQPARRSASLFFILLSLLRRFTTCHSKPGDARSTTQPRLSSGVLPRTREGDIAGYDPPTCSSLLPSGQMLEATREPLSPSDDPYPRTLSLDSRPLREGTTMSFLGSNQTTTGYPGAADSGGAETNGLNSMSNLHLSPQTRESSMRYPKHRRPVRSHSVPVHNSIADLHHRSTDIITVPLDLPSQPLAISDLVIDIHPTVPPSGNEGSDPEVVTVYDGPQIGLLVAEEVGRRHEWYIPRSSVPSQTTVPAMTVKFPRHNGTVPPGWTTLVHPQGSRYFVHQEKRTFTQMNICDEEICDDIEYYMEYLLDKLHKYQDLALDVTQVDLVLEPKLFTGDTIVCCYYFANHRDRCLFWLDEYSTKDILSECNGVENLSHIRLAIQAQYWKHCDYFPYLCPVTQNLIDEVKDMLMYAKCDHLTSRQSTAPFDAIEIEDYLSIVDRIKVYPATDKSIQRCHAAIVIGRIMYAFSRNHFLNSHGENCVRLNFEQTVHPYTPSLLIIILAPFLFFDPMALVRELHTTFVDNMPSSERWNAFNSKLNGQFQDSNLQATVLLSANVSFLSINSVDAGGRSPTQIACYMSLVASLGSMIIGLLLVSHTRTMGQGTVLQGEVFLSGLGAKERGLEKLAIIYSLPKTLLMWGMIFFFVAFSIHWWSPGDETSRAVVGSVILVGLVMISYGIIRTSNRGDRWWRQMELLLGRIGVGLLSHLTDARQHVMEFMEMRRTHRDVTRDPRLDTEVVRPAPMRQANAEATMSMRSTSYSTFLPGFRREIHGSDNHENHPNSSTPSARSIQPTASVDPPLQPHDSNSMLPPSYSRISTGLSWLLAANSK